ncbi:MULTISPECIES: YolD-like family protein [Priestia]|uniref:YolD-like family protein n=1 Tax=Priestia TaxID=2800373 RepID=UPI001178CAF0|nr:MULTISPECIES: YolD-like family protein [Priestia]MBD8844706.1 YolD-like family protein [Priestia megaterium]MCU7766373.1 YolD-like family protein [Priestia megaterium]MDN4865349.1 YolD-like family protein [Priestia megaterium]
MILKALRKNQPLTISYYENGLLQTFRGQVYNLNWIEQTLSLTDEHEEILLIHLSGIKEIH